MQLNTKLVQSSYFFGSPLYLANHIHHSALNAPAQAESNNTNSKQSMPAPAANKRVKVSRSCLFSYLSSCFLSSLLTSRAEQAHQP